MQSAENPARGPHALPASSARIRYGREYLIALAAALVLYAATVAPGPLWQDNGLAQLRVLRHDLYGDLGLALSHPLYYVLAIAFQVLPFGESALKTNLVSAVFGAITVANAFLLLRLITARRAAAAIGAISLALAHTFWQLSVTAEVYSVTTALTLAELLCFARYLQTGRKLWLPLLLLASGLSISNHMLAALNLPVWAVVLVWLLWQRRIGFGTLLAGAAAWLAGAAIYLAMIGGEIAAGHPVGDVLRSALFGDVYAQNVLNMHLNPRLLVRSCLYLVLDFPTPVALLAFVGLAALRRLTPRPLAAVLGAMLAIHLLWAFHYNVPDQYTFFVVAIAFVALVIGLGADRFLQSRRPCWASVLLVLALLPPAVYAPLPWIARAAGLQLGVAREIPYRDSLTYFLWPWKTGDDGAQRFAAEVQGLLPTGAVLIGDQTSIRPIHYLMLTGQWTADVSVWPRPPGTADGSTLWPPESEIAAQLHAGKVYVVSPQPNYCPNWLVEHYTCERAGIIYRVAGPKGG